MTYAPTEAQTEAIKNGASQLRVALDPQPNADAAFLGISNNHHWLGDYATFVNTDESRTWPALPFAPGDTFPVTDDMTATVTAVKVERLQDISTGGIVRAYMDDDHIDMIYDKLDAKKNEPGEPLSEFHHRCYVVAFADWWNATAAKGQMFDDNPWVAVATIETKGTQDE